MPAVPAFAGAANGAAAPPTLATRLTNVVVFQAAWFAAVLGAANQRPLWGTAAVALAIGWHLAVSRRASSEAVLVALACAIGFVAESAIAMRGVVVYSSGQPVAQLAPYRIVAMWGLLAIALNVTLRWLKPQLWLAAALGAVAGPASFSAGVGLGGAAFVDRVPALATLAAVWCVALPALVWLSRRFDGVAGADAAHA